MTETKPDSIPLPNDRKVLVIGWDAADWRAIRPLLEQGKMPNLQRMMDEGVHGNNATITPVLSPMLWTSIATGKRPFKHGIHGFSEPTPDGKGIRPITNVSRKVKAVWNILNQCGKKPIVVGWWPSHPAEPVDGVMVSDWYQKSQAIRDPEVAKQIAQGVRPTPGELGWTLEQWPMPPGTVHPPRLERNLQEFRVHQIEVAEDDIGPFVPSGHKVDQEKDQRLQSLAKIIGEISSIHAAATALMQLEPWDFMAVYLDGIDHFCHGFMKYHPPRQQGVSEEDFEIYSGVVEAGYRMHDLMLGAMLELAGKDTTVILLSDHGFHPDHLRPEHIPVEPAGPAIEHRTYGIFVAKGPGIRKGGEIAGASVLDLCPTVLSLYGLPVGRDMDGKPLVTIFENPPEVASIESWESVPGQSGMHRPEAILDSVQSAEAMKQLVELGYIEEPNEDTGVAVKETVRELRYNLAQSYMDAGRLAEA
ncbi:MAG: alkaline phosphatase family protein, partial [Phycisphaerales bacterium]